MNKKLNIVIGILIAVIVITASVLAYNIWSNTKNISVYDQKIYQESTNVDNGMPGSTNTTSSQLVDIQWMQGNVVNSDGTCNLYDKQTKQIYFTFTGGGIKNSGSAPITDTKTYYKNDKIGINEAADLASQHCFK
ncbi:MAG: hypothetical protein Q7T74_07320 [Candidatus Saccharibacteria bacterium]|nr:hypothetical protein [Candidatus Saccharibacteria bacterium]